MIPYPGTPYCTGTVQIHSKKPNTRSLVYEQFYSTYSTSYDNDR